MRLYVNFRVWEWRSLPIATSHFGMSCLQPHADVFGHCARQRVNITSSSALPLCCWQNVNDMLHISWLFLQMLSECLLECHKRSVAAGKPFALKMFISGRNRLENDGATALAEAFKVSRVSVKVAVLCQFKKQLCFSLTMHRLCVLSDFAM